MIPKKIHYCWFGGNPLSEDAKKYIETWRKYCPEYEIVEWNESNFDINENQFCREAYEAKKWAFVSDYARLKVLYTYGGIYMDTDVEVCKNLDPLLKFSAVSGYESKTSIPTGTMAACRGNEWIEMLLHDYDNKHFFRDDGTFDDTTNVKIITRLTKEKYAVNFKGEYLLFGDNMAILPFDYLCAKDLRTGEVNRTNNTYTIHHFTGSWLSEMQKKRQQIYIYNWNRLKFIPESLRRYLVGVITEWTLWGLKGVINKMIDRMMREK